MDKQWSAIDTTLDVVVDVHIPVHPATYKLAPIAIACVCLQEYTQWHCSICDDPDGKFDLDNALSLIESWGITVDRSKFTYYNNPPSDWLHDKRNHLIWCTTAPLIANIDSDDYYYPTYLSSIVPAVIARRDIPGNFKGKRMAYSIPDRWLLDTLIDACGSGHWVYRREWQEHYQVWYDAYIDKTGRYGEVNRKVRNASDEAFLQNAERLDNTFNRYLLHLPEEEGKALRIRHGNNTCRFSVPPVIHKLATRPDEDMSQFLARVDYRFSDYYKKIAEEIDKTIATGYGLDEGVRPEDMPCVCICLWKRQDSGIEAVYRLAHEAPHVFVWHNGDFNLPDFGPNVTVFRSPKNIGPIGRFLLALSSGHRHVIYWDDDMIPKPGWYDGWCKYLSQVKDGHIIGQHGILGNKFASRVGARRELQEVDYIGTGGMMCKTMYASVSWIWQHPECYGLAEDVALCVGARRDYKAKLLAVPSLKEYFAWKNEKDANAIYVNRTKERAAMYDRMFPKDWECADRG